MRERESDETESERARERESERERERGERETTGYEPFDRDASAYRPLRAVCFITCLGFRV